MTLAHGAVKTPKTHRGFPFVWDPLPEPMMRALFLGRERSNNQLSLHVRQCRFPFSCCASLLEPMRVVRVAQVASYAATKAVHAALPIVPLDPFASFEQHSILTTGAPFKVLTRVRVAGCGKCLSILEIRHT
jgi:hypothetical protein